VSTGSFADERGAVGVRYGTENSLLCRWAGTGVQAVRVLHIGHIAGGASVTTMP
jgi:hypothetical protein